MRGEWVEKFGLSYEKHLGSTSNSETTQFLVDMFLLANLAGPPFFQSLLSLPYH